METDQVGRLRDILDAARLIGSYVKDTTETDFRANVRDGVRVIFKAILKNHSDPLFTIADI